jgi:pyruvate dehydrogenase E2 component (dihydrolipoamide acetyltransferase)
MAEIRMPSLGADMDEGTLLEWRVTRGDHVARGAIVALIETQKATMELESFLDGDITELLVEPGAKVPVGTPLARVRTNGEVAAAPVAASPVASTAPSASRIRSSPAARKRARELEVELRSIHPSGPHGAVVLRDVERAASTRAAAPAVVERPPAPTIERPPPAPAPAVAATPAARSVERARPAAERRPIGTPAVTGSVRAAIAAAMTRSKREIPHYYLSHAISLEAALGALATINASRPIADRILPAAVLLHAVTRALWVVPELNGFWIDDAFRPSEPIHLGNAVALRTGGVIAPAILDADQKSLDQLMTELRDLVGRARAGRLRSSELTDATITVTSLGDRGCEAVWGVINPPQVAIIGFGAIAERPWASGGHVSCHHVVTATLSADHRVTDGHRGGRFLAELDRLLQEPITP